MDSGDRTDGANSHGCLGVGATGANVATVSRVTIITAKRDTDVLRGCITGIRLGIDAKLPTLALFIRLNSQ